MPDQSCLTGTAQEPPAPGGPCVRSVTADWHSGAVSRSGIGRRRAGHFDNGSDTRWFDPGEPAGWELEQIDGVWTSVGDWAQDCKSIPEFVPAMQEAGFSEELIAKLIHGNPWSAYSR